MKHKVCTKCLLDTTVKDIWFDTEGICKYCYIYDELNSNFPLNHNLSHRLDEIVRKIKQKGKRAKYDCVVGLSGGRDSTYTLYKAVSLGLKPLAVHFDNGWNTEISIKNIKNACETLDVELYTVVADWEEFRKLQLAFLHASTPDADIPTDYAIYSILYNVAAKENIKFILNGHSFRTEGTSPISWTYMDPIYVKDVLRKHGEIRKVKSFSMMSFVRLQYYIWLRGIREVRLLEYIDYVKKDVDVILENELSWRYYGGHHHENSFTKFFQSYYLPVKFDIDKRKTELSAMIRSGHIKRNSAIELLSEKYKYDSSDISFALKKLQITSDEWNVIMNNEIKSHQDFKTLLSVIKALKWPLNIITKLGILPRILYLKYAK